MVECTRDALENMFSQMELLNECFPTIPYFPSKDDLLIIESSGDKYYDFVVYLLANNPPASTPEETECVKRLNDYIRVNTNFVAD